MIKRWQYFNTKMEKIIQETHRLKTTWAQPGNAKGHAVEKLLGQSIEREYSLLDLLKRPNISYADLATLDIFSPWVNDRVIAEQVEVQVKYAGYIDRQQLDIERQQRYESLRIPESIDYRQVSGLSSEVRQKLSSIKPDTLGMAARISGVTPAAISLLLVHLRRMSA
ncbi:MAG: hypothetical protein LRY43_01595 [Gammaproteobacteria bacterium]|nr:hypothetical protein [Gammaproteobacteria bacterium]